MARLPRIEFEGAVYHVTARGNERQEIFRGDADRKLFLETLKQTSDEFGLVVVGYCLMPNHYHLLVETPRGNLSRAMGHFQTTYTVRFNRRHERSGHLFQGRYKAHLVEADRYAMELLRYVHLNPVRPKDRSVPVAGAKRNLLSEYRWSSHRLYLGEETPPAWMKPAWLKYFGKTPQKAHTEYRAFIEAAFDTPPTNPWDDLYRGLVLGGEPLRQQVSTLLDGETRDDWDTSENALELRQKAVEKIAKKEEKRWQIWLRVRHGGERRAEVARSLGYSDGSAVTHVLKRLERQIQQQSALAKHREALEKQLEELSSVKHRPR